MKNSTLHNKPSLIAVNVSGLFLYSPASLCRVTELSSQISVNQSLHPIHKKFCHRRICLSILIMFSFYYTGIAQTTNENNVCKIGTKEQWRELADSGRYDDAIVILLDSIQKNKHINKNSTYWHLGQLYACNNKYEIAIEYMKKSTSFFDKIFDREWRLYYMGTIAFLEKDKPKLKTCNDKLWNKHSEYYYFNACKLKALYENFDKPYKLVYEMSCE